MTAPSHLLPTRTTRRFRPPRFGLGGSPIGNLPAPDGDARATSTIDAAYNAGIRFFDTSPAYGLGVSEQRFGTALARHPRGEYLVSTKVGGIVTSRGLRTDFSAAGIRQSLTESLERLRLESVDMVFIQDPGDRWQQVIDEAYPVLHELRTQGILHAIGAAMNDWQQLDRFVRDTEVDTVLLAGQYSLLDQSARPLLDRCQAREVAAIVSGILTPEVLQINRSKTASVEVSNVRARRIAAVCEAYGVSLPQVALAFPTRHPAVTSVLIGAASPAEIRADAALVRQPVPASLWTDQELSKLLAVG
jgi:D-threo-aldose 1-dehydrogenase